ncbi:MAG: bifunctional methylenetetrahydrofolate dehydrogenase/methenyltetrahydrofolate cyclohydrolase FolD [Clostridia bacterium]|jgi:methylenetetrahydrofolate dehydrogenase (NADP+)/methenyltetrahydrofolate cyclohydrolase|nr:bifunctional methylenetetrahydrofolate dehydrogenase/methenyltetrahydrofolate cyclohydrolase FolD [Clostridia bacterium]
MAEIISGKTVSAQTREKIKAMVSEFETENKRKPCLAVVLVGNDPASEVYVRNKIKGTEEVGMKSLSFNMPENSTNAEVEEVVKSLADDENVDGILVQLPLPKHLDERKILSLIPDTKDVDGFSPNNLGLLSIGTPRTVSCTPLGVMELIKSTGIDLKGKNAVVIGRSNTVGKPMAMLLLNENCTVTVCHSKTDNIAFYTKNADIVVVAVGRPEFLKKDMVKDGAVVIDVGINRVDGKLVGDVDFDAVSEVAGYITPVPGGVGPMTISMLLYNTLMAAKKING